MNKLMIETHLGTVGERFYNVFKNVPMEEALKYFTKNVEKYYEKWTEMRPKCKIVEIDNDCHMLLINFDGQRCLYPLTMELL